MSFSSSRRANLLALGAIALWATLAWLGTALAHVPPFLLTGLALLIGSVVALPLMFSRQGAGWAAWKMPLRHLALGVYGLFGYHFCFFMALRLAEPVQANLLNYLWPLGIVVLAPLLLPGVKLSATHLLAACLGFAGAAWVIVGGNSTSSTGLIWGYLLATASAFIWATYSLLSKRLAVQDAGFPTAAIGLFGLVSGALSLFCHVLLEPHVTPSATDGLLLAVLGLGPLGAAFYLWDAALKLGDARQIGILSYITPLASTLLLLLMTGQRLSWSLAAAGALIIGAAVLGTRAK